MTSGRARLLEESLVVDPALVSQAAPAHSSYRSVLDYGAYVTGQAATAALAAELTTAHRPLVVPPPDELRRILDLADLPGSGAGSVRP